MQLNEAKEILKSQGYRVIKEQWNDGLDNHVLLDLFCDEILKHNNEDFVIEDEQVAEAVCKYFIMDNIRLTTAKNEDEFANEVNNLLSGTPIDGSPIGASEAENLAREIWQEKM